MRKNQEEEISFSICFSHSQHQISTSLPIPWHFPNCQMLIKQQTNQNVIQLATHDKNKTVLHYIHTLLRMPKIIFLGNKLFNTFNVVTFLCQCIFFSIIITRHVWCVPPLLHFHVAPRDNGCLQFLLSSFAINNFVIF